MHLGRQGLFFYGIVWLTSKLTLFGATRRVLSRTQPKLTVLPTLHAVLPEAVLAPETTTETLVYSSTSSRDISALTAVVLVLGTL